jgi:hypothetical protein
VIPYVTPTDLLGDPTAPPSITGSNDQATLGINFNTISVPLLWQMCWTATAKVDEMAAQTLRGASFYEELSAPGHRVGILPNGTARFVTSRKPLLSVISGQAAYGRPPWQWNALTLDSIVLEVPVFNDFASYAWEAANPGQASLLIGAGIGWGGGRLGTRIGIRMLTGWPITGLLPAATTTATFTESSNSITVESAEGIVIGSPVTASQLPASTVVTGVSGETLTLNKEASASGSGTLTVGYAAGVTSLNVDDITTWGLGVRGTIFDGLNNESALSVSVSGETMTPTPVGPGTITLATPTLYSHLPNVALSAMPGNIRWAVMLAVKAQALERGAMALTAQSTPGKATGAGMMAIQSTYKAISDILKPYRIAY